MNPSSQTPDSVCDSKKLSQPSLLEIADPEDLNICHPDLLIAQECRPPVKPAIGPIQTSSFRKRLSAFLPELKRSNEALMNEPGCMEAVRVIEDGSAEEESETDADEGPSVEMSLSFGAIPDVLQE